MTSKEPKNENVKSLKSENKISVKGGSVHEKFEVTDEHLDEPLHNNNPYMELAMQTISNDKTLRNGSIKDLKDFNSQFLTSQAKKTEQLVSMMLIFKKTFDLVDDDIVKLSTKNEPLKNEIVSYDENR